MVSIAYTLLFFYKNLVFKNFKASNCSKIKNIVILLVAVSISFGGFGCVDQRRCPSEHNRTEQNIAPALSKTINDMFIQTLWASTLVSRMLLMSATSGAKGNEATNKVTKPNWITNSKYSANAKPVSGTLCRKWSFFHDGSVRLGPGEREREREKENSGHICFACYWCLAGRRYHIIILWLGFQMNSFKDRINL